MPNTLLTFDVEDRRARAAFSRLKREVDQLDREFNTTRREAREAGEAIDALGNRSRTTARDVDRLGDAAQQSATRVDRLGTAAKRTNTVWRDTNGRLRDARGRFVGAGQGAEVFADSLDGVRGILTGLGAALAAREIFEFGTASVRAAGQMEGLLRGLRAIEDSQVDSRLPNFNENAIDGRTGQSVQGLNRQLREKKAALAAVQSQFATNANALRAFASANTVTESTTTDASKSIENYGLALARLSANAENTRTALTDAVNPQQLTSNFQAALAASNAYYNERIRQAEAALTKAQAGTEAHNTLETQIFELGRQRLQAQRQLETQRTRLLRTSAQERVSIERSANSAVIAGFSAVLQAARDAIRARVEFEQQIAAIPNIRSPETQHGTFTSHLRRDFAETEQQGHRLLLVMRQIRQIANYAFGTDLDERIPDPIVREAAIDERIAAEARGHRTLTDIRQAASEQGRQFLNRILRSEERDIQGSLRKQARAYRQFANLVSNTFINLATGRAQNFESVAKAFLEQSLRIVLRAVAENQVLKRLDDTLTASRIANIRRVTAAQQAASASGSAPSIPGIGGLLNNLPGLSNIGSSLSGGGAALGAASLLFPTEIKNLAGGISDTIGNLLSNVASAPDRAFGAQQVFLKIGENETREITDLQEALREENRV